jgi:hypothetical protein
MRNPFRLLALISRVSSCLFVAISLTDLSPCAASDVSVREVDDYTFGGYSGEFVSPPSADGNPRRAVIVEWAGQPWRLVFWHEASYCPYVELRDGSGACFQFLEGNDGWAELFNQFGRLEKNSFVKVIDRGPRQVHVRWAYFGVNQQSGERAYQATEDFYCLANSLVLRRQAYQSLLPKRHEGYSREPIELIGMCPVGKTWKDVLRANKTSGEHHALAALDAFSNKRYDVYWKPNEGSLWDATPRRSGCNWTDIDESDGVVLVLPMKAGAPFCAFGTASGFDAKVTKIKEHSHKDTGGNDWVSSCWDHWPVGWINSQGHVVDATSLAKYPNHFSPAGMDFFAMGNAESASGEYWSLIGDGSDDLNAVRRTTSDWLELGNRELTDPSRVDKLGTPAVNTTNLR